MDLGILMQVRELVSGTLTYIQSLIETLRMVEVEVVIAYFGRNAPPSHAQLSRWIQV